MVFNRQKTLDLLQEKEQRLAFWIGFDVCEEPKNHE